MWGAARSALDCDWICQQPSSGTGWQVRQLKVKVTVTGRRLRSWWEKRLLRIVCAGAHVQLGVDKVDRSTVTLVGQVSGDNGAQLDMPMYLEQEC